MEDGTGIFTLVKILFTSQYLFVRVKLHYYISVHFTFFRGEGGTNN